MNFDAINEATSMVEAPWEGYKFVPNPKRWDRSCHKHPCSETDRLDAFLNELAEREITPGKEWIPYCLQKAKERNEGAAAYDTQRVDVWSDDDDIHQYGGWVEIAAFLWFGIRPNLTVNTFRAPDLPLGIEIKGRTHAKYDLKISPDRKKDPDDRKCVLARCQGIGKEVRFEGWITAKEGRRLVPDLIDPRRAGRPFHAVPEHLLWPMRDLKKLVEQWKITQKQP